MYGVLLLLAIASCVFLCVQFNTAIDMPSDAQRIQKVKLLVDSGHSSQVLLSHDLHTKHRQVKAIA